MSSDLPHLTLVHHDDLVGPLDRTQAMRDHDRGTSFDQMRQGVANPEFSFGVDARSRFIENQDLWIVRQSARKRNELLLSG